VTVIVVMGVTGCGKSTVGRLLAERLGGSFAEGDAYHPPANVAKMARGEPLTDDDRGPWLDALAADIGRWLGAGETAVVGCSALKRAYRERLHGGREAVCFVHLTGDPALIRERMSARQGHYMPVSLLPSQLATLEPPAAGEGAIVVDVAGTPESIVEEVLRRLRAGGVT
jgi:carbohydrate kinase (thermoresistant glucokinase family)